MKIRADFVTNSSSSSYVTFTIHNELLARIIENYEDGIFFDISVDGDKISGEGFGEQSGMGYEPEEGRVAEWITFILGEISDMMGGNDTIDELIGEIQESAYDINKATSHADIKGADVVSDGDGTSGFHTVIKDGKYTTTSIRDEDIVNDGQTLYEAVVTNGEESPEDVLDYIDEYGETVSGKVRASEEEWDEDWDDEE